MARCFIEAIQRGIREERLGEQIPTRAGTSSPHVCVRERETERDRERQRETERDRERVTHGRSDLFDARP